MCTRLCLPLLLPLRALAQDHAAQQFAEGLWLLEPERAGDREALLTWTALWLLAQLRVLVQEREGLRPQHAIASVFPCMQRKGIARRASAAETQAGTLLGGNAGVDKALGMGAAKKCRTGAQKG